MVEIGFDTPDHLIRLGPTIDVFVGFDPEYKFNQKNPSNPNLPTINNKALIDTGASGSCIDSTVALTLNLPIINEQSVAGAHGAGKVNVHLAQIYIPALNFTLYKAFFGVHLIAGGQPHHALLGRDFLQYMTMDYKGNTGSVTLSRNS